MAYKAFEPSGGVLSLYEEGTFTPVLGASVTDGTVGYAAQVGSYVRFNNWVHISLRIVWSTWSGSSGTIRIKDIPFAGITSTQATPLAFKIGGFTLGTSDTTLVPIVVEDQIWVRSARSNANATDITAGEAAGDITLTGIYEI
jgi:hypothetical protein